MTRFANEFVKLDVMFLTPPLVMLRTPVAKVRSRPLEESSVEQSLPVFNQATVSKTESTTAYSLEFCIVSARHALTQWLR